MPRRINSNHILSETDMDLLVMKHSYALSKKIWRSISKIIFLLILLGGAWLYFCLDHIGIFDLKEQDLTEILEYKPFDNTIVYDHRGNKIGEFFSSYYIYTPYEKIPRVLIEAVTAIEDRDFFQHSGIDLSAIVRAALSYLDPDASIQGASTITQQVVRNFILSRERTFERKVREISLALLLEKKASKEKILEIYLNAFFLGNGAYGVGAAAHRYFGKPLNQLKDHEIALIAGLFQSPSAYNPQRFPNRAKKRQRMVIRAMYDSGKIPLKRAKWLMRQPLKYERYNPKNFENAPYFVDYIRDQASEILGLEVKNLGLRIYTTLDMEIQRLAQASLKDSQKLFTRAEIHLADRGSNDHSEVEAAMIAMNPSNGHILAMYGGRSYEKSQFNRATQAKRAPGSVFKPVIYSLALERGFKWSDVVYVSPIAIDDYRPRNYSSQYLTETTLLKAFYQSINTPVIELGQRLGLEDVLSHAQRLGINSELRREAGSLLGSSEVTLLDMAKLYSTFANQGLRVEPVAILKITDRNGKILYEVPTIDQRSEKVMSPQIATLMTEGMRAVLKYGTASSHKGMSEYAVGKTGTTNFSKDNWFCGFTNDLVSIVWTGTDHPDGFDDQIASNTLALPLWASFMKRVAMLKMPEPVNFPEGIVVEKVNPDFGTIDPNGVDMYFIDGQTPNEKQSSFKSLSHSGSYRNIFDR